jgi:hypothetical protein
MAGSSTRIHRFCTDLIVAINPEREQFFVQKENFASHVMLGKMKTDKSQFDEVLRRMLKKPPQKTATIHAKKQPKKAPSQGQK